MRIDLRRGSERIELLDRDEVLDFTGFFHRDERAVAEFLIDFLADPVNLSALRRGLLDHRADPGLSRLGPRELAQELARRIAVGEMEIRRPRQTHARRAPPAAGAPPPRAAPAPAPAAASAPPPEEGLAVDPAAQAEALEAASASGAPFCDT